MQLLDWFHKCVRLTNIQGQLENTVEFFSFLRTYSVRRPDLVLPLVPVFRDVEVDTLEYWQAVELAALAAADVSNYSIFNWFVYVGFC